MEINFNDEDSFESIEFTDDQGESFRMYVLEQTKINGVNYLLVCEDPDSEDAEAYILKETMDDENQLSYQAVEDDRELEYIGKVFEALLE